jgi:hypothetical protein
MISRAQQHKRALFILVRTSLVLIGLGAFLVIGAAVGVVMAGMAG